MRTAKILTTAAVVAMLCSPLLAGNKHRGYSHRGHHHHHYGGGYRGYRSNFRTYSAISVGIGLLGTVLSNRSYGYGYPRVSYGYSYPSIGYGYQGCGYGFSPYGVAYSPRTNSTNYYLPPIYQPAELNYGPGAVKQFMGVDRNYPLATRSKTIEPAFDASGRLGDLVDLEPLTRRPTSNADTRARAARYVAQGDRLFGEQQTYLALMQYRQATKAAGDVADSYFRQGFALLALGKYDEAVDIFKSGLAIDKNYFADDFRLDDVYQDNLIAKNAHIDALAKATLSDADNADLMFLVGAFLHFDGETARSVKFLMKANDLAGGTDSHIQTALTSVGG